LRLLVYEHISGGGFANRRIPVDTLSEGYSMLSSLISDFKTAGHNVTTMIDSRLATFKPPLEADKIVPVSSPNDFEKALKKGFKLADAAYFVAPESDQTLQRLMKYTEKSDGISLNCRVAAVETAANKMATYETLDKAGLAFPETLMISVDESIQQIRRSVRRFGFSLVFKPLKGMGCQGLSVVNNASQIKAAVNKIKRESSSEFFLVQKLLLGVATSVSLISTGREVMPITLNQQLLTLEPPESSSSYCGGVVPLHHSLERRAIEAARKAVESVKGLTGYIGVDIILTRKGPFIMEINPRLTTSYVGLTRVVSFNPAQAIIDAVLERRLPKNVRVSGSAFFSKVKVQSPSHKALLKTYELGEVVSPPFPVGEDGVAYALLVSKADKLDRAKIGFNNAKKHLNHIVSKG